MSMARSKTAQAASARRHYERNKETMKARAIAFKRQHKVAMYTMVNALKAAPCTDCGIGYPPCVMDFDHVGPDKLVNVSTAIAQSWASERILAEIAKCELVCANCHRLRTAYRAGRTDSESGS